MEDDRVETIRETPFGKCIGARLLDITATENDEFRAGEPSRIYFHFSNGETIFATMGTEGNELMGVLDLEADEEEAE